MGRTPKKKEDDKYLDYLRSGRDEMNLLEHSISSADTRPDLETRSILFESKDTHPETGELVERNWEVTFSAKYGRPTPKDDDVFVALMKVSQDAGLMNVDPGGERPAAQVHFSSYQLIRILGWPDKGASYQAIDDAFNRIGGVWIVSKNFWWDNVEKEFADRKFGIIEDVFLYERDKYDRALKKARLEGRERPLSWIRWSEVMLDSFQAGYVRKLDIDFYRTLQHPTARKLYRYLGKQFWKTRTRYAIDLPTLCHEKLGYSKRVKLNAELRRKIEPAIQELEEKGAYGLSHEFNASYGQCEVIFNAKGTTKSSAKSEPKRREPENPLDERLLKFGIDRATVADAVKRLNAERIISDIEHVEFEAKANRIKSSKAGMLASMLKADEPWPRPQGFKSSVERELTKKKIDERKEQERLAKVAEDKRRREQDERELAEFNDFMAGLSPEAAIEFDERAKQTYFFGERYRKALKSGDAEQVSTARHLALFSVWKKDKKGEAKSFVVHKSIHF